MQDELARSVLRLKHEHLSMMGVTDPEAWLIIEKKLDIKVASQLRDLYAEANGFSNYHYGSQLILWSLERTIEENAISVKNNDAFSSFRIGDFLIESDYIIIELSKSDGEVRLLYENRVLAKDVISFLQDMVSGKFDFMS